MMPKVSLLRRLVLRSLILAYAPVFLFPASAQTARVALNTRATQTPLAAQDKGVLPATQRLSLTLTLAQTPARSAALDAFLVSLTTSSSSSYHQWLTPAQFAAAYGATPDQLAAATLWAQAQGLSIDAVSPSGSRISMSGTSAQLAAAFATELHAYTLAGAAYFANTDAPSLPADTAPLFTAVEGLDNLPASTLALATGDAALVAVDSVALGTLVDANATPLLALTSAVCTADLSASEVAAYAAVFRQAAAQGITTLSTRTCAAGAFPAALAEVVAVALPSEAGDLSTPTLARPGWQAAPGLPADALRHTPDLTVSSLAAFAQTLTQIAGAGRLGNINPVLYALGPTPGLYTQADAAPAGTWQAATGLGLVDLTQLGKVYPRGVGSSFTSFQATNYSPLHGQGTSFSSNVTSGTGGATPTGTVSFVTSTGTTLGTATLVSGSGSITINTLEGGNFTISAVYSGDATYASSSSAGSQLYVQPEPSALTVAITGNATIGGSYNVTVTDTASSGVGIPSGPVSVTLSGTGTAYTAALAPSGANSASATVTIPATTAGTLTLSIQCTASPDFSCFNPYTTTVTIAKATPTLSISYSPNPPVSGASITLNGVVSTVGTAPAPTGAVTFFDNGTTLNAGQLFNGSTSTTGTVPTTISHSITASYAGDANYLGVSTTAGSTSSGTIKTTLALVSSTSTVTAGASITFTATLTATSTGPAAATGTVTFLDSGAQIGTANLSGGTTATFTTTTLSATTNHTITAIYSGDGYYSTSTSNAVSLAFSNASTTPTITLSVTPTAPVHGQKVQFAATVAGTASGAVPTGTVTFSNVVTGALGQATLVNGSAVLATAQVQSGTSAYTASYSGDSSYSPVTSTPYSLTVLPEPDTLRITVPPTATFGLPFVVSVNLAGSSGIGSPTGTVTVQPQGTGYSTASSSGVAATAGNGTAVAGVTVQGTGAGAITFTATYTGDANFAASGPVSVTASIAKTASSTTLALSPTQPISGQPTTLIAKVAFVGTVGPTGTVQFFDGTSSLGTANLDATGTATLSTTFSAGNHVVRAAYSGDGNYLAGTSPSANTTTGITASTTSLTVSSSSVPVGGTVTLGATVGPVANGATPTGTVQIFVAGNTLCTITLAGGQGSCTYVDSTAGTLTLTANYLGDTVFGASNSTPVTLTAGFGTGSLTATLSASTIASGGSATVNSTVTAPVGTVPTGSIAVALTNVAGTVVATATTQIPAVPSNTSALAISITAPTVAASYTVTVSCLNTNFSCSSVSLPLTVGSPTSGRIVTTTSLTAAATTNPGVITLNASVTPASIGVAAPTGTVTFLDGTTQIGSAIISSASLASTTVTLSTSTTHSITAVYAGDSLYAGSSSAAISGVISTATSAATITLIANTTAGLAGTPVVLTATVAGTAGTTAAPTGTVAFYTSGATSMLLGTSTLGTTGPGLAVAVLTTNSIPAGTPTVYAVYSGDPNFKTVTSNAITFGQGDYTVTFNPPALTLTAGQSGQTSLVLGLVGGFAGTVNFACTPPPDAEITCSFSPLSLTGGGSTVLTFGTVAAQGRTSHRSSLGLLGIVSSTVLLLLLLPFGKRRRLPLLLLALFALALASNLGCGDNSFPGQQTQPVQTGTPLGTTTITVTTVGTSGSSTIRHNYAVQLTVQ